MTLPPPPHVFLEDRTRPGALGRLYRSPVEIVRCEARDGLRTTLAQVQAGVARGLHAAGFLAYEAAAGLETRLRVCGSGQGPEPLAWFGLFERCEMVEQATADEAFAVLPPPPPLAGLQFHWSEAEHRSRVEAAQALIAAGDIYQVNLTYPVDFTYKGDPLALYAALRVRQPVAHGGVVATGEHTILSVSPELFVAAEGRRLTARPMKGTAPRGVDPVADVAARAALPLDPKQQAENLMITDLLRNDLSRVCQPGTVRTPSLFTVETYPTFHALTSTVNGLASEGVGFAEVLEALFPCGSIVGAPKIRAAEVIAELEDRPRGVYCGAIGAIAPGGEFAFNVAIRTAIIGRDGRGRYGVGGGLVADSEAASEYAETRLKARVLTDLGQSYDLIETLRWSSEAGFVRLEDHLSRLAGSAAQLGFDLDDAGLRNRLASAASAWAGGPDRRVRILLARDGVAEVSGEPQPPELARPLRVGIFADRLDAADPFLRHKTTRREIHEAAAAAAARDGFDEMLLLNQYGRIADGARNTLFLPEGEVLLTPPLADGALPGVLRAALLRAGRAREANLDPPRLSGRQLLVGNSLRGLRKASLDTAPT